MEKVDEDLQEMESIHETTKDEQPLTTSLLQSLLLNESEKIENKKKKKIKSGRQKELERLTKATKTVFTSPEKLNIVCERVHSLLLGHKSILLDACRSLDNINSGRLSYEQFRLVIRDRLPEMSSEDIFILAKLFDIEGLIDYSTILDEKLGNGILRYVSVLPVPQPSTQFLQFNNPRYLTVHLRLITFDSYNAYPGHIHLTISDQMSIYTLSKLIIDQTDFVTRSINIFREKTPSRQTLLDPMRSLEHYGYLGTYKDGTHNQSFPTITLYYDHSPLLLRTDCPIFKCDYYMK